MITKEQIEEVLGPIVSFLFEPIKRKVFDIVQGAFTIKLEGGVEVYISEFPEDDLLDKETTFIGNIRKGHIEVKNLYSSTSLGLLEKLKLHLLILQKG